MHWQLNALGPACTQRTKKGNLTGNESIVKFMDRKFLSWSEFQLMELNCRNEVKITCKMKNEKKKKGYRRGKHQQPLQIQGKCNWLEGNLNW